MASLFGEGASLGELVVTIGGNAEKLFKTLADSDRAVKTTGKEMGELTTLIGKTFTFACQAAAIIGLGSLIKGALEAAQQLNVLSQRTGVSVEQLSLLKFVAEQTNTSIESVATGLKNLSRKMFEASEGTADAVQLFEKLNISVKDSNGNLRNAEDVLLEVADRFKTLKNDTEKTAIAVQLFGRQGTELIPILNLGSEGIRELEERAKSLGLQLTTKNAKAIEELDNSFKEFKASVGGLALEVGTVLLPVLTLLVEVLKSIAASTKKAIEGIESLFSGKAGEMIGKLVSPKVSDTLLGDLSKNLRETDIQLASLEEKRDQMLRTDKDTEEIQTKINNLYERRAEIVDTISRLQSFRASEPGEGFPQAGTTGIGGDLGTITVEAQREEELNSEEEKANRIKEIEINLSSFILASRSRLTQAILDFNRTIFKDKEEKAQAERKLEILAAQTAFDTVSGLLQSLAKENKAAAIAYKSLMIGRAVINTAEAVSEALPNLPLAILVGALGAAEIATIASQGFAKGTDSVPAMLSPNEMVIPATFAEAVRDGRITIGGPDAERTNNSSASTSSHVTIEKIEVVVHGNLDEQALPDIMEQIGRETESKLRRAS